MGTFAEIQDRVSGRLIDLPTFVADEVPALVNQALRSIQKKHNFEVMLAVSDTLETTIGVRELGDVPADFKEYRGLPYRLYETAYPAKRLILAPNRLEVLRLFADDDVGPPQVILEGEMDVTGAREWEAWPLPDGLSEWGDGEYRVAIPYWRFVPALDADGDTNWFTVNAEQYLVDKATALGFPLDWDEERAVFWETKAASEMKEVILADKYAALSRGVHLTPSLNANDSMLRW